MLYRIMSSIDILSSIVIIVWGVASDSLVLISLGVIVGTITCYLHFRRSYQGEGKYLKQLIQTVKHLPTREALFIQDNSEWVTIHRSKLFGYWKLLKVTDESLNEAHSSAFPLVSYEIYVFNRQSISRFIRSDVVVYGEADAVDVYEYPTSLLQVIRTRFWENKHGLNTITQQEIIDLTDNLKNARSWCL